MLGKTLGTVGGLAIGLALTKKLAKDPSNYTLAAGGAAGAGLGYIAGDLYDANDPLKLIASKNPAQNAKKFEALALDGRSGELGEGELELFSSGFNTDPSKNKGILSGIQSKKLQAKNYRKAQAYGAYMQRAKIQRDAFERGGSKDEDLQKAYMENERRAREVYPYSKFILPGLGKLNPFSAAGNAWDLLTK